MAIFGPGNPNISNDLIRSVVNRPGMTGDMILNEMQRAGVSLDQLRGAVGNQVNLTDNVVMPFLQSRGITPPAATPQVPANTPPTGLIGSEQALQGGLSGSLQALQEAIARSNEILSQTRGDIQGQFEGAAGQSGADIEAARAAADSAAREGVSALQPFVDTGSTAFNTMAALLGASGRDAQRDAFNNFQSSPGQQFIRDQGERAILRNAAATGGTGGGNVLKSLQEFNSGLASQDFNNQLNVLNQLSQTGFQGAGTQANLFSNLSGLNADLLSRQAGINANLSGQSANLLGGLGSQGAGQVFNAGLQASNQALNTGGALSSGRTRAGELLSSLSQGQGAGLADIINQSGGNLANLLQGSGQDQATSQQQLAQLLSGLAMSQSGQVAGLPGMPGVQERKGNLGSIGQAAGGIGAAYAAFSDERLKENIKRIGRLPNGIGLYSWDWNQKGLKLAPEHPPIGVIAQEVLNYIPEAVTIDSTGYFKVDYGLIL